MRPPVLALLFAGLVLAGGASSGTAPAGAAERAAPVAVGQPAPPIALADQHGRPFRLAEAVARHDFVVVAFYVKAFTGG